MEPFARRAVPHMLTELVERYEGARAIRDHEGTRRYLTAYLVLIEIIRDEAREMLEEEETRTQMPL
jgi:hypothetical protein